MCWVDIYSSNYEAVRAKALFLSSNVTSFRVDWAAVLSLRFTQRSNIFARSQGKVSQVG